MGESQEGIEAAYYIGYFIGYLIVTLAIVLWAVIFVYALVLLRKAWHTFRMIGKDEHGS